MHKLLYRPGFVKSRRGKKDPDPAHSADMIDFALEMGWINSYEAALYTDTTALLAAGVWLTYKQWRKRREIHNTIADELAFGPAGGDDA